MITSFRNQGTEDLFNREDTKAARRVCPANVRKVAQRKLDQLNFATQIGDMRIPPNNQLEKLKGDRDGQWSVRVNQQFRVCFAWSAKGPSDVEIVDYHS